MDVTLSRFVSALRKSELEVSPAETLDALEVIRRIGVADPVLLRDALRLTLAKTSEEKRRFDECFQRFFVELAARQPVKQSFFRGLDKEVALERLRAALSEPVHGLVADVFRDRRDALAMRLHQAGAQAGIEAIASLRDKSRYAAAITGALGLPEIEERLRQGEADGEPLGSELAGALRYVRHYLGEEIQDYVDAQYRLRVDASGKKAVVEAALAANLTHLPPGYHGEMRAVVRRIAARLAREHRRRQRQGRRGQLDVKRTLRRNVAHDGTLIDLHWKRRRRERATVFALCDVSGSVSRVARFLLLMLHELGEVLPDLRLFAFSSGLAEITGRFKASAAEAAIEEVLFEHGTGSTDYGRAFTDFRELALRDLGHRSTVIILGDGRSNYFEPRVERFAEITRRAGRVLWLNPEDPERWGEGDSEMQRYAPHCFRVLRCSSLTDLERFAEQLLTLQR